MGITDFVTKAVQNTWALFVADGVSAAHRTPSVVVGDGRHRTLRRFGPEDAGDPILLVTPLAASSSCFDLTPDHSLVQHLVGLGRSVFLIEYGDMTSVDRDLGLEFWIDDVLPEALERVSELCGDRDVDVLAWSIAGTLAFLTAAAHPELPIRSIAAFGTPIDYEKIPLMGVPRLLGRFVGGPVIDAAVGLFGGVPAPIVQTGYRLTSIERELKRPLFIARHIADRDKLARMEFIDRFQNGIHGYSGRAFEEIAMTITVGNALVSGKVRFGDRVVDLAEVNVPVLALGGTDDVLAPIPSVEPVTEVLTGAPYVRFVTVPGTHLGLLTSPSAKTTSWVELAAFLDAPLGDDREIAADADGNTDADGDRNTVAVES